MNLQGRNFLTLKDFTPEEIRYFLDTAKELKEKKKNHVPMKEFEGRNIALILKKQVREHAARLKSQHMIWEWV